MCAQASELRVATKLLSFESPHARVLDRKGIDERERPEPEVQLGVEHTEEYRTRQTDAVGEMQTKLRGVHRNDAVEQTEGAADTGGDSDACHEPLPGGHALTDGPGERSGKGEHQHRQLE